MLTIDSSELKKEKQKAKSICLPLSNINPTKKGLGEINKVYSNLNQINVKHLKNFCKQHIIHKYLRHKNYIQLAKKKYDKKFLGLDTSKKSVKILQNELDVINSPKFKENTDGNIIPEYERLLRVNIFERKILIRIGNLDKIEPSEQYLSDLKVLLYACQSINKDSFREKCLYTIKDLIYNHAKLLNTCNDKKDPKTSQKALTYKFDLEVKVYNKDIKKQTRKDNNNKIDKNVCKITEYVNLGFI